MSATNIRDLIIIGGGPAGLSAAVNASSEAVDTLIIDSQTRFGGQAATSSLIENYPGFPCGVSGQDLMARMEKQADVFGTEMLAPATVVNIQRDPGNGLITVMDDAGECFTTRSVALAMGVQYRRLDLRDAVRYLGRGVSYGSPSIEDSFRDQQIIVVGGANSAGQAAMHLSKCSNCTVHLVIRGDSIGAKMSHYLVERIEKTPNIIVHTNTNVTAASGESKLELVTLSSPSGEDEIKADQMFVMIGAMPKTAWLRDTLELERGYIMSGRDLTEETRTNFKATCNRPPYDTETSVPGVFAVGDVRANAVRRVGAAVGSGSQAMPDIHRHLATLL